MTKVPTGVLVLSVLATFAGIMNLIWGLRMMGVVTFGPVESGNGVWLAGLFTFIVGLIYLGVGGALMALRPWALMFAQIMAIFGIVSAVFAMFSVGFQTGLGLLILPGFVFWYTNRESVVAAFANSPNR